jgi:hypothetical protein
MHRLPPQVEKELDQLGRPWRLEYGKKHARIMVEDDFVTIWPRNGGRETGRKTQNIVGHIRRYARTSR